MIIIFQMQLYFLVFLIFSSPLISLAKYQVCSITINSSDEIEVFKKFLDPEDFEFVELLPQSINEEQDHSSHWFDKACEKNYQCDILVISGHFGGTFFGKSGYSLPTELMEEKSCKNTCGGILSGVKEIFLFGCNTLASKEKDHRTHSEYLQVLLEDGMSRETAERVVAARYSPLETSFSSRMNFIFSGSHTIYGFDELSPLGKHVRTPLSYYFQSINNTFGSYANYLNSNQHKREVNTQLFEHFPRSIFTLNQSSLSLKDEDQNQKDFFNNKCLLYDSTKNFSERMNAMEQIFLSSQAGSAFFAIDYFLNYNKTDVIEGSGRRTFRLIRENSFLAEEFLSYYEHLKFLPYIAMVYLNILEKFQWMDPLKIHLLRKENLKKIIEKPGPESYVSILFLLQEEQLKKNQFYFSKTDLPENYINSVWALLIFEKLKAIAPEWQEDIFYYCENNIKSSPAICYQSLNTLAHIKPEREIALKVLDFLESKDESLIYYSIRLLGQSGIKDYHVHKKIADFLKSKSLSLKKEAIEALGFLKTPYGSIQEDIAELLKYSNLYEDIFWSLSQMNLESLEVQKKLLSYINHFENTSLKCQALSLFSKVSKLSDLSLFFFYDLLESRENKALLFCAIESLSKNSLLRDQGIYYRFLLFQEEKSIEVKRQALEKMQHLTWLHPEVQISFLSYLDDQDLEVKKNALKVLQNVKNLKKEVSNKITK
ncbi:MAG: hypothetical protein OXC37_00730 [Bdellovibrionaceae bacterium]|nr:hypothetical protein [Pseudobdellovibrionaceae bacterium]